MNKLNTLSTEEIEYMRNRVKYYGELPDKESFLTFLDDIEDLNHDVKDLNSELDSAENELVRLQDDSLEEEGFKRAMEAVEKFYRRVARGTEEYSPERLIAFLEERK